MAADSISLICSSFCLQFSLRLVLTATDTDHVASQLQHVEPVVFRPKNFDLSNELIQLLTLLFRRHVCMSSFAVDIVSA